MRRRGNIEYSLADLWKRESHEKRSELQIDGERSERRRIGWIPIEVRWRAASMSMQRGTFLDQISKMYGEVPDTWG